ncbi:hypothetical protein M3Y97_00619200 [Aphelenchoides bicaudatus]|nr:hypothetical protein M3Y97_00619200 [Aphelenchoides bicaudatus]
MDQTYNSIFRHQYRQVSKMFSDRQTNRLIELIKENEHKLFPNSFSKPKRCTARKAWSGICQVFNAEFPEDSKTPEQIRIKWKNMLQKSRALGNEHLLFNSNMPIQQFNDDFPPANETFPNFDEIPNSSLANVLGAFSEIDETRCESLKTERESSVFSILSEPNSNSASNHPSTQSTSKIDDFHPSLAEPSSSQNGTPTVQVLLTEGPPIVLGSGEENRKRPSTDDLQPPWLNSGKRKRTLVDEIDELKKDLLTEELQNSKKFGLVLDEALSFLKRLNQPNGMAEKLSGFLDGHYSH